MELSNFKPRKKKKKKHPEKISYIFQKNVFLLYFGMTADQAVK